MSADVCIFGGGGFLGKNIKSNLKPSRSECDLLDAISIRKFFEKHNPTSVINCAAEHDSFLQMSKNHTKFLENNILITINLLRECHRFNVENVLFVGSISGFPEKSAGEMTEEDFHSGEVADSNFGYNMSKRVLPSLVRAYQLDYGRKYKVVHLGNIYGPQMEFSKTATLVGNLVYKVWEAKRNGQDLRLFGSGNDVRSLTFVEDVDFLIRSIILRDDIVDPIILSSGFETNVSSLVKTIALKMEYNGKIIFTGEGEKSTRKVAKGELVHHFFPEFHFTPISDGLDATIEYFYHKKSDGI